MAEAPFELVPIGVCMTKVVAVFDREFGERISALADEAAIWIVQSPANSPSVERMLSEGYFPYTDTTERFGKMRVFLRKHGWKPIDERENAPED